MSTSVAKGERKKRRTLVLRPSSVLRHCLSSSRAQNVSVSGAHGLNQRHTNSVAGSCSRRSFSLGGGSKVLEKSVVQTPRQAARVFDEEDNDVTPLPLYQADPGSVQARASRFFVDEISTGSASDQTTATGSFTMPFSRSVFGSSRISSQSTIESMNEEIEETISKRDMPINFPDVQGKRESVREQLTEEMLRELIDVDICETDSISLLDIPSTLVSVDADDAEVIVARNNHYADVCRNRMGNDKYTDQSVQTLNGAAKNKHVQSDSIVTVDTGATVTTWDMYDTLCDPEQDVTVQKPEPAQNDYPEAAVDTSRAAERSLSVCSTASTASAASSLKEMEVLGSLNAESDLQLIMLSVRFQQTLLVMERSILGNTFQPQLAAYRQLPVREDPDRPMGQRDKDTESCRAPALERLWSFSCELSRGRSVSSMAWNRKNPDLLAVGYGESDSTDQRPGLVCCWSFKNPTWPERVLLCDSAVTSLDFSAKSPGQLAVGLHDGTVNIYNVQSQDDRSHVFSSSECPNKHLGPVWQLRWTQQELSLTGEEKTEALFSVCADGRISKWFVFNNGLDCTDVMKLKRIHNTRKNNKGQRTESVLSALTPGLCVDFHPTDSSLYLAGTGEGLIHKFSCSNSQQFLETFREHFGPVNQVAWCPHSPDVFLSCSSDWTIQLWKQDHLKPVLGFTSTQTAVCDVQWSPKWATVFGAVNEEQLEIWDLNWSILDPVSVQPAAAGVKMTSLLFATQTECVLVGDSDGQVTVYQLKNLSVGDSSQVGVMEELVLSAASR
ncbi:dynein axonemal intermediate chain 4 isoform X1 [Seriola aureovittata]|uniref:dynein axonemal intermediate chain 4 isoform X1 n=2 Tax=Seriola TaxID=8160 RepID=UPI0024BDB89F|nr:dynein axonemal intermediate chain 4 isoform X1 [Seriola aureovittata]